MSRLRFGAIFSLVAFIIVLSSAGSFISGSASAQAGEDPEAGFAWQGGTTGGELRKLIDISSPWSGGYIHEELTVIGRASITDSFTMNNLSPGSDAAFWKRAHDAFDIGFGPAPARDGTPPAKTGSEAMSSSVGKPVSAVAGTSIVAEAGSAVDIRAGFRWFDLF